MKTEPPDICHFSSAHPLGDVRISRQCQALAEQGYRVRFIGVAASTSPHSPFVERVALPPSRGRFHRFFVQSFRAGWWAYRSKAPLCQIHDPECIPVALLLRGLGRRVVYDIHENNFQDIRNKTYLPALFRPLIAWTLYGLQKFALFAFDGIFAATDSVGEQYASSKTRVLRNMPRKTEFLRPKPEAAPVFGFVGGLSERRGAIEMVRALDLANQTVACRLRIASEIPPALLAKLEAEPGWAHVDYLGYLAREEVARHLSQCWAGLVLFHPGPNHTDSQPNKLFEYMAAEIAVIASNFPLWRSVIEKNACGICVDPKNIQAISTALVQVAQDPALAREMGARGRRLIEQRYCWEAEEPTLLQLYGELSGRQLTKPIELSP